MKKIPQFLLDLDEEYRDKLGQEDRKDMELFVAQHVGAQCVIAGKTPAENGVYLGSDGRWHALGVFCPTHGHVPPCGDVENGGCSVCSSEFHAELIDR